MVFKLDEKPFRTDLAADHLADGIPNLWDVEIMSKGIMETRTSN